MFRGILLVVGFVLGLVSMISMTNNQLEADVSKLSLKIQQLHQAGPQAHEIQFNGVTYRKVEPDPRSDSPSDAWYYRLDHQKESR